jgi:hypothetical protein
MVEVAIAANKEHFPRVIQILREANVPEEFMEVAKRRKAASPKFESDSKGSVGPERVSGGF